MVMINHKLYTKQNGLYTLRDRVTPPKGKVLLVLQDVNTGALDEQLVDNLFVTAGMNSIADRLRGADKGSITYCALGTNNTAPTLGDTTLNTELTRKLISVRSASGNVATLQTFYNTSEANDTLLEAGLFGDSATLTANSGTLFARTIISRVKNDTQTLSIYWTVTIGA